MKETWKPVLGFEGYYSISSLAQVRNDLRGGRILKPTKIPVGYLAVMLFRGKERWLKYIHRLFAQAFVPGFVAGLHVNHKNGNKLDNTLENLEWVSQADNNRHAAQTELFLVGEKCPWSKLSASDVKSIRCSLSRGESQSILADSFNVSIATINDIKMGRTWKQLS